MSDRTIINYIGRCHKSHMPGGIGQKAIVNNGSHYWIMSPRRDRGLRPVVCLDEGLGMAIEQLVQACGDSVPKALGLRKEDPYKGHEGAL